MTAESGAPQTSTNQQKDEPIAAAGRSDATEGDARQPAEADVEAVTAPVPERNTGESGPGSSAAAQGEHPAPAVEQTQTGSAEPRPTDERPITGVHRTAAPNGEVAPQ